MTQQLHQVKVLLNEATQDAALAVACGSPSLRRRFIAAVGHEDAALDGRVTDLVAHYAALKQAVETTIASRTTEAWKAHLDARGVPASDVALPIEILDHEQPAANAMFHRFDHHTLGPVTVLGPPSTWATAASHRPRRRPPSAARPAPSSSGRDSPSPTSNASSPAAR